jgi:hypothetical protein
MGFDCSQLQGELQSCGVDVTKREGAGKLAPFSMLIEKVKELVEAMAKAEAEYGSGFYSYEPWRDAYDELLGCFGFDEKWSEAEADRLREQYRALREATALAAARARPNEPSSKQILGMKAQEERQRQRQERKANV